MKKALFLFTAIILLFISFNVALAEKDLFEGMLTYNESQYYVGFDMQPGEYVLLATGNSQAYFSISSDANSNRIICNDNFEINRIITVYTNDYVTLKRCIAIKAEDFYQQYTIKTDKPGIMLRVGYDIMPGTYKIQQVSTTSSSAYYCIYTSHNFQGI